MIFQPSKEALVAALSNGGKKPGIIKIAKVTEQQLTSLNAIRVDKGWDPRESPIITLSHNDVSHILKRITQDGLTPQEVGEIAEHALSDDSIVARGQNMRAILINPVSLDFGGGPFAAHAILNDAINWETYRLFGLIPKGWRGRK